MNDAIQLIVHTFSSVVSDLFLHAISSIFTLMRVHGIRCCSGVNGDDYKSNKTRTPQILKFAVSGVTEVLRLFSSSSKDRLGSNEDDGDKVSVSSVDDVITVLKSDYENAYFVTGIFTSAIYDEDCIFEDPTIRFQGTKLYSRNLQLLVPFFDHPSIELKTIEKDVNSSRNVVQATWKLRTYLKFPWRPLISIDGSTIYELDKEFKIVKHSERWDVSALEAIAQIFTPGAGKSASEFFLLRNFKIPSRATSESSLFISSSATSAGVTLVVSIRPSMSLLSL